MNAIPTSDQNRLQQQEGKKKVELGLYLPSSTYRRQHLYKHIRSVVTGFITHDQSFDENSDNTTEELRFHFSVV